MRSHVSFFASSVLLIFATACSPDRETLIARHMENGGRYLAEKNYSAAIIEFRNVVTLDDHHGEARLQLGDAYIGSGDLANAMREYVRAADILTNSAAAQVKAGQVLLDLGLFAEARARATTALTLEPKNAPALVLMGNSLAGLKDMDGAIQYVESAIDADPSRTLTYANLGVLELARGNRELAEETIKRAIAIDPTSSQAHLNLANFYWATGKAQEAEQWLKTAVELEPASETANKALGTYYLMLNRPAEAEPFLAAFAEHASDVQPKLILADYYLLMKKPEQAHRVLDDLSKTDAGFVAASVRRAMLAFQADNNAEGHAQIAAALGKNATYEDALVLKTRALLQEQKIADAQQTARTLVTAHPLNATGHFMLAMSLDAAGSVREAITELREVLRIRPASGPTLVKLGELYLRTGDPAAASEVLGQAVKGEPQSAQARLMLSRALIALGNLSVAERELALLSRAAPKSPEVNEVVGDFEWARGNVSLAGQAYRRALEMNPSSVKALTGVTAVDLVEKRPKEARSRVEAALAERPADKGVLLLAGNTFISLGDAAAAESSFRRLLEMDPANLLAYNRLAALFVAQNRLQEAKVEYEQAASKSPRAWVPATTMVGMILSLQGEHAEARKRYQDVLSREPQSPVAANNLAWDYAQSGQNLDVAQQLAQTAMAGIPGNGDVTDTLGWIYYKRGLSDLAVSTLEESARLSPSNPVIHYHLGMAYLGNGSKDRAARSLNQALKLDPVFSGAEDAKKALAGIQG